MFSKFRAAASATVFGLAAVVMTPSASAAIVTGSWDPPMVSPPFDNLGWATTINFSVPDDCLGSSGIINLRLLNLSLNCSSATPAITVLRAQIGIYDLTSEIFKYVVTLDPSTLLPQILDISAKGEVTYLFSLLPSASERQTILADDLTAAVDRDYWFRLAMPGGAPVLRYSTSRFTGFSPASGDAPALTGFRIDPNSSRDTVLLQTALTVGSSLNPIPEPHSLALTLLALASAGASAGAVARQGRHRNAPAA